MLAVGNILSLVIHSELVLARGCFHVDALDVQAAKNPTSVASSTSSGSLEKARPLTRVAAKAKVAIVTAVAPMKKKFKDGC